MARPRTNLIELEPVDVELLQQIVKSRTEELRRVQRAKIILMAFEGFGDDKIAEAVQLHKNSVRNTISKFLLMGVQAALSDLSGRGRPAVIDDDAKAWLVSQACVKPKDIGYPQELWTIRKLTDHVHSACKAAGHEVLQKIAPSSVWKILDSKDLKPHRIKYFLEKRDPEFENKMNDVLLVYKDVQLEIENEINSKIITISFDEKPGIQAIANITPDLPPSLKHGCVGRDYEYKRLGTVSLLAGLNLISGEVTGLVSNTHKSSDFIEFLKIIDTKYELYDRIRLVLDNHTVHTSKETRKYLETRPGRFEFIFTPKHGSWLNLVESFFGKLTRACLKGIRVESKEELIKRIYQYLDEVNENPVVYRWKYKMDTIEV